MAKVKDEKLTKDEKAVVADEAAATKRQQKSTEADATKRQQSAEDEARKAREDDA